MNKPLYRRLARKICNQYALSTFLFLLLPAFSVGVAYAQVDTSIAGVCGQTGPCNLTTDLAKVFSGAISLILNFGLPALVLLICLRFVRAWWALYKGSGQAYKEAKDDSIGSIIGIVIIVLVAGGIVAYALEALGVDERVLQLVRSFRVTFDPFTSFFTHAYAQEQYLPNFLKVNNLFDAFYSVLRVAMRFFLYPAMIVIWVATGFAFVAAQGNPEKISTAKKWLVGAFITTAVIFLVQTFLLAIRGTILEILPGASSVLQGEGGGTRSAGASANGSANESTRTGSPSSGGVSALEQSLSQSYFSCLTSGTGVSGCFSSYTKAGGTGDPVNSTAAQAYDLCRTNGNTVAKCSEAYTAYGGTGDPTSNVAGEKGVTIDCGEGFRYDHASAGCLAVPSKEESVKSNAAITECKPKWHFDTGSDTCVSDDAVELSPTP